MAEQLTPEEMDLAAQAAAEELGDGQDYTVADLASWWKKWYLRAGHKRLGRILLKYAKKEI